MSTTLRFSIVLLGAVFALQGLGWLVAPQRAASDLGMPLLDGLGRSTQIGDFASFFFVAGGAMLLGALALRGELLRVAAALFGCAALGRTLAWLAHGADLAAFFIAVEVAVAVLLLAGARRADGGP
jgi:hypothetical protein